MEGGVLTVSWCWEEEEGEVDTGREWKTILEGSRREKAA